MKLKVWDLLIIGGLIIGIIGCFLLWGMPTSIYYGGSLTGFSFEFGAWTFFALMFAAMFQLVFMSKRKVYMILGVLISGSVASYISLNWILNPVLYCWVEGAKTYTVLYGAYVTLLGGVIVSGMALRYIAATAKRQLSLSKSS